MPVLRFLKTSPAARGFPPTPGRARFGADPWRLGAERQEAGEIRMFNHWATGLRSGLLPQDYVVAPESFKKN